MDAEKKHWRWWQKGALGISLVLLTAIALVCGARKRWVEPLAGVRVEMSRPVRRASDFGPDSAYRLFLEATEPPLGVHTPPSGLRVWHSDWTDAVEKLEIHLWPSQPPPPAPLPEQAAPPANPVSDGGIFSGSGSCELPGLPAEHPALAVNAPWTREQYEDVQRVLQLYEPKMALLDRALAAPDPQMPTFLYNDVALPPYGKARSMARFLSASAKLRAGMGDYAGSVRDIGRCLGVADLVTRGGPAMSYLVGTACDQLGALSAWDIVCRYDLPADALRQLARTFLVHADGDEPLAEVWRAEATFGLNAADAAYQQGSFPSYAGGLPSSGDRILFRFAWLAGSSRAETTRNLASLYGHAITLAEKPYSAAVETEIAALQARLRKAKPRNRLELVLRTRDPVGFTMAEGLLDIIGTLIPRASLGRARGYGMALHCAVRAYQKDHGLPPERLDQLVPDYLPRLPKDPFSGKPFRYLRSHVPDLPEEAWAVYSVGPDFSDDGGAAHVCGIMPSSTGPAKTDLVWPSTPYSTVGFEAPQSTPAAPETK